MDNLTINQKIAASAKTNETRIKRMVCRNDHLDLLKADTKARIISELSGTSKKYEETIKQLIIQGMIRMLEDEVEIKVRKGEQDMISKMLPACEEQFSKHMKQQTGRDTYKTKLTIIKDKFLTVEEGSEFGGVILYS